MSTSPLKIVWVCSTINELGGPAVHIRNLYKHLNDGEFQLTLIFCSQIEVALCDFMLEGGVNAKDMIFIPHASKRMIFPFVFTLRDIFRREKFDIVHAFETQTQVLAGWAAFGAGVKKFICHCDGQFLPATVSLPKRVFYRTLNFFLKGYFSRSITISNGLAQELVRGGFRPASKVEVVHLGISPLYEGAAQDLSYSGLSSDLPVFGTLSRLSIEKGLYRFIKAAALVVKEIPSARFVICGSGPQETYLRNLVKDISIDGCFDFKPWTNNVADVLKTYDVYVMPSFREGLGITLLEAMSLGRPAIASDIEGIRDVIDNDVDGLLVDTSDVNAFARAMISLCRDPRKAIDMGHRGLEKVRSSFHVDREMHRIREIYYEISGSSNKSIKEVS